MAIDQAKRQDARYAAFVEEYAASGWPSIGLACHDRLCGLHQLHSGASMFTRSLSAGPKMPEPRTTSPTTYQTNSVISAPSTGEKSVIGNDLKIMGQGLKIISRGMLQVDGEIEGDVMAVEVVVGEKGRVSGMVAGQQVVVRGTVSGVVCGKTVALQA